MRNCKKFSMKERRVKVGEWIEKAADEGRGEEGEQIGNELEGLRKRGSVVAVMRYG